MKKWIVLLTFLVAIALACAQPIQCTATETQFEGWQIKQRNKFIGNIELSLCPAGCIFHSALFDGYVRETGKEATVTLLNGDSKLYGNYSLEAFLKRARRLNICVKVTPPGWKRSMRKKIPDGKILGFKVTRYDFDFVNTSPPYQVFPDQMWASPELHSTPRIMGLLRELIGIPQDFAVTGTPLKIIETLNLRTHRQEPVHETLSIKKSTFKPSDFQPPPGFKRTTADEDLFNFGL